MTLDIFCYETFDIIKKFHEKEKERVRFKRMMQSLVLEVLV